MTNIDVNDELIVYRQRALELVMFFNSLGELNNIPLQKTREISYTTSIFSSDRERIKTEIEYSLNEDFAKEMVDKFLERGNISFNHLKEDYQEYKRELRSGSWPSRWVLPDTTKGPVELFSRWSLFRKFRKSEIDLIEQVFILSQYADDKLPYRQYGVAAIESRMHKIQFDQIGESIQIPC